MRSHWEENTPNWKRKKRLNENIEQTSDVGCGMRFILERVVVLFEESSNISLESDKFTWGLTPHPRLPPEKADRP